MNFLKEHKCLNFSRTFLRFYGLELINCKEKSKSPNLNFFSFCYHPCSLLICLSFASYKTNINIIEKLEHLCINNSFYLFFEGSRVFCGIVDWKREMQGRFMFIECNVHVQYKYINIGLENNIK